MSTASREYAPSPWAIFATCVLQGSRAWIERAIMATKSSLCRAAVNKFPLVEKDCIHVRAGGLASQVRTKATDKLRLNNQTKLLRTSCAQTSSGRKTREAIS